MTVITTHMIETYSGRFLDFAEPDPGQITLDDIAHGLAHTCRYGGQCKHFYSVAEHSILVAEKLWEVYHDAWVALLGLHHDDHEAYIGDIPRSLKKLLGDEWILIERRMDEVIAAALGHQWAADDFHIGGHVKDADNWALMWEARYLLPSGGGGWDVELRWPVEGTRPQELSPGGWTIPVSPERAKSKWLACHAKLKNMIGGSAL